MNVTKKKMISQIAKKSGMDFVGTETIIDGFLSLIQETLLEGKNIEFRGFGTFKVVRRKEKKARNPKKNLDVIVPERNLPVFKFNKEFKTKIAEKNHVE